MLEKDKIQAFQFTHPVWGATGTVAVTSYLCLRFQFTHPVWGATDLSVVAGGELLVSIHAPRVGCDVPGGGHSRHDKSFNSRTPCGVRQQIVHICYSHMTFQFTHPVWGATL